MTKRKFLKYVYTNVSNIQDAFQYLADCQLATVAEMAMKKSRSKREYERQMNIAQLFVDWAKEFIPDKELCHGTRLTQIIRQKIIVQQWVVNEWKNN